MLLIIANTYFKKAGISHDDQEIGDKSFATGRSQIKIEAEVCGQTDTATEQSNSPEN
ncbi:MAG: hypothetical protein RIM33_04570 [Alphaproteobacteria bacterium]